MSSSKETQKLSILYLIKSTSVISEYGTTDPFCGYSAKQNCARYCFMLITSCGMWLFLPTFDDITFCIGCQHVYKQSHSFLGLQIRKSALGHHRECMKQIYYCVNSLNTGIKSIGFHTVFPDLGHINFSFLFFFFFG